MTTGRQRELERLTKKRIQIFELYKNTPEKEKPFRQVLRATARVLGKKEISRKKQVDRKHRVRIKDAVKRLENGDKQNQNQESS